MNILEAIVAPFRWSRPEDNRRRHQRVDRVAMLVIQPLDNDLSASGTNYWAMSKDISESGIGFISAEPIETEFLRVTIVEDNASAIAVVRHWRELTDPPGQFFVGVEFMEDSKDYLTSS